MLPIVTAIASPVVADGTTRHGHTAISPPAWALVALTGLLVGFLSFAFSESPAGRREFVSVVAGLVSFALTLLVTGIVGALSSW